MNQTASWGQCFQNILDPTACRLYPVGLKPYSLDKGDLNGDGNVDLVSANYVGSSISVLLGDGAGGFDNRAEILSKAKGYPLHSHQIEQAALAERVRLGAVPCQWCFWCRSVRLPKGKR